MNDKTMTVDDMQIQREAQAWVIRLESGRVGEVDAKAFRLWCSQSRRHATAFKQARVVWQAMQPAARQLEQRHRSDARGGAYQLGSKGAGRRAFLGGAVTASVAYLAFRPPLQLWPSLDELAATFVADYQTATGEQREILVNEGVRVQMNTQTAINLKKGLDGTGLELLAGEAEIEADATASGKVLVLAGSGMVSAQGARFNIRHIGNEVCVTCLNGQVEVSRSERRIQLNEKQQLTYSPDTFGAPQAVNTSDVIAWRQRMLVFNQALLSDVVAEVNRYRPGKLILRSESLARNRVHASFSLDHLDDLIGLIRDAYGAKVTRLPGGIVLLTKATA